MRFLEPRVLKTMPHFHLPDLDFQSWFLWIVNHISSWPGLLGTCQLPNTSWGLSSETFPDNMRTVNTNLVWTARVPVRIWSWNEPFWLAVRSHTNSSSLLNGSVFWVRSVSAWVSGSSVSGSINRPSWSGGIRGPQERQEGYVQVKVFHNTKSPFGHCCIFGKCDRKSFTWRGSRM